jgi:pyridoxamine 5'-phosphate oxidase-like protein
MITWTEFEKRQPALAAAGREHLYQVGVGLGFLATVRRDGGPRVHPVCPVVSPAGLHVLIIPGPKLHDLRRDGRYALHGETYPPPREDDGFAVYGRAREIDDSATRDIVRKQLLKERDGALWPNFDEQALFELGVERCLLMLTHAGEVFPQGATAWKA